MIVTRFTFFTENFCDLQFSSHQHFPLWARLYQHVFCKKPSLFSSSSRYRNLGPSESACRHYAYTEPGSTFARDSIGNSWEELEVSRSLGAGFLCGSEGLLSSTKFSLNSCSQCGKSCNRSLCTSSCPSFLFLFSVSVGLCSGFPRSSSLVLPLLSGTGFSVYLLSNTESCDEDDDEVGVGVVEELADKPGTTNGT